MPALSHSKPVKYCSLVSGPTNAPLVRLCKEQEKPDRRRVEWLTHWIFLQGSNVCVVNDFGVCDFSYANQKNEWRSFSKSNHIVLVPKPNQTSNINDSTKVTIRWNMSTPCQQSSFWNWSRCCIQCITADLCEALQMQKLSLTLRSLEPQTKLWYLTSWEWQCVGCPCSHTADCG